jgi:hypothetical protein
MDTGLVPMAFTACTANRYVLPFSRALMRKLVVSALARRRSDSVVATTR